MTWLTPGFLEVINDTILDQGGRTLFDRGEQHVRDHSEDGGEGFVDIDGDGRGWISGDGSGTGPGDCRARGDGLGVDPRVEGDFHIYPRNHWCSLGDAEGAVDGNGMSSFDYVIE